MTTELDALKVRMNWMNEVLAGLPEHKIGPVGAQLGKAIEVHVAGTGEALSRDSIRKAAHALSNGHYSTLNDLSTADVCHIVDPKLRVSAKHLKEIEEAMAGTDPKQRILKARLEVKNRNNPVWQHREVLERVGTDATGAIDGEVLRSANARANALKGTPDILKKMHALEADVIAHQNRHFGKLSPSEQKARLNYLNHDHALPQAKEKLMHVKTGNFKAKEWTHAGIKGKFTQHADGTVLHHVKVGKPVLIAAGLEHEAHLAAATTSRMQRMGGALKNGFGKTAHGIGSTISGVRTATGYVAPAVTGTKKAFGKGLKLTGWTALAVGGITALGIFSSRARNRRHVDNLPPSPDYMESLAPIPDFSTPAPASRQVLGPHTARVLGVGGNAALQPDMMAGDSASLVDGKPVGNLGPSPN